MGEKPKHTCVCFVYFTKTSFEVKFIVFQPILLIFVAQRSVNVKVLWTNV